MHKENCLNVGIIACREDRKGETWVTPVIWFWATNRDKEQRFLVYKLIEEIVKRDIWDTGKFDITFVLLRNLIFYKLHTKHVGIWRIMLEQTAEYSFVTRTLSRIIIDILGNNLDRPSRQLSVHGWMLLQRILKIYKINLRCWLMVGIETRQLENGALRQWDCWGWDKRKCTVWGG